MNTKSVLEAIVKTIRAIPERLSGDDSPLADPWEEIKEQLQHEMSFFWQAYLDTMNAIIEGTVHSLSDTDRAYIAGELHVPINDSDRLRQAILKRLLAKAKREKVRYAPFDFTHFRYSLGDLTVYAEVLERTGLFTCEIMAYSGAAPYGERGEVNTDKIEATMSIEEFEQARQRDWPDRWEVSREPHTNLSLRISGCDQCWPASAEAAWDARAKLVRVAELADESHYHVMILSCQKCGQGFLSVFTEMIDWSEGDDAQYWTLMPISEEESAHLKQRGSELTEAEISSLGTDRKSLFMDYPTGQQPRVHWGTGIMVGPHD